MIWLKTRLLISGCAFFLALDSIAVAQMGGGGHMGGNSGGIGNGGMGGGIGNGGMGFGVGMMGAVAGMDNGVVTVGSDGNLYVLSRVFAGQGQVTLRDAQTKLSALDGNRGNRLWSLVFEENWLTKPVQGPDGRLFLVGFADWLMGLSRRISNSAQDENSQLYIVDPSSGKAITSVKLDGEVASVPTVAGSGANYTVYVVAFDTGYNVDSQGRLQGFGREATLYAFDRNGALKFSLPLDR